MEIFGSTRTPDMTDIPGVLMLRLWSVLTATAGKSLRNLMSRQEIPSCGLKGDNFECEFVSAIPGGNRGQFVPTPGCRL